MGTYTSFELEIKLITDLPIEVIKAIDIIKTKKYLRKDGTAWNGGCLDFFSREVVNISFIDHPIFEPDMRLSFINIESFKHNKLKVKGYLKNYSSTIEKFLDWISQYVDEEDCKIVGSYDYDGCTNSAQLYFKNNEIKIVEIMKSEIKFKI